MRQPDTITQEIQQLDAVCMQAKEIYKQFPKDNILRLNVQQYELRKVSLVDELTVSLKYFRSHTLKYIFKNVTEKINLDILLENLNSFKNVIDKTLENVTEGRSNHLPIYFNTVFLGSYGIQLSTPFEEELFEHPYEEALNKTISIFTTLTLSKDNQLKEILNKEFGEDKKLLNVYSLFFKKIHQSNKLVEIEWISPHKSHVTRVEIEPKKAKQLYSTFNLTSRTEEVIEKRGVLKGLSLMRYKVEFAENMEDKHFITANFEKDKSEELIGLIDKYITAKFKVSVEYNIAKDEEERKYELIEINDFK